MQWSDFVGRIPDVRILGDSKCQGGCPICASENGGRDSELNLVAQLVDDRINFVCFGGHSREAVLKALCPVESDLNAGKTQARSAAGDEAAREMLPAGTPTVGSSGNGR